MEQSQAPAKQDLTHYETGNTSVAKALSDRRMSEKEVTNEQIKEALRYCMLIVGIRANNMPANEEKQLLVDFVRRTYSGLSVLEIKLAFDMAIADRLELQDWKCYENFSCAYVSTILKAYCKWVNQNVKYESNKRENEAELTALPPGETDWSDEWEKIKESARKGAFRGEFITTCIYDWLKRNKMITLSGAERWQLLEDCRQAYALEMREALHASPAANPEGRRLYELLVKEGDDWRQEEKLWSAVVDYSKRETVRIEALNAIANEQNQE